MFSIINCKLFDCKLRNSLRYYYILYFNSDSWIQFSSLFKINAILFYFIYICVSWWCIFVVVVATTEHALHTKKQVNVNCSTEIILNTNHEVINFQFPCGMNLLSGMAGTLADSNELHFCACAMCAFKK